MNPINVMPMDGRYAASAWMRRSGACPWMDGMPGAWLCGSEAVFVSSVEAAPNGSRETPVSKAGNRPAMAID